MSDDLKVDWGRPIPVNGVKPDWLGDGCQVDVLSMVSGVWYSERAIGMGVGTEHIGWSGVTKIRLPTDHPYYQIASYKQPDIGIPMTDDLAKRMEAPVHECGNDLGKRMEALVRKIAQTPSHLEGPWSKEARAIVALLPEPVDADLVEARECVAAVYEAANRSDLAKITRDGGQDKRLRVQSALAAIRRGRAIERDSREG